MFTSQRQGDKMFSSDLSLLVCLSVCRQHFSSPCSAEPVARVHGT